MKGAGVTGRLMLSMRPMNSDIGTTARSDRLGTARSGTTRSMMLYAVRSAADRQDRFAPADLINGEGGPALYRPPIPNS